MSLILFALDVHRAQDLFCSIGDCDDPCQDTTAYTECTTAIGTCHSMVDPDDTEDFFLCVGQTFDDPAYDCTCVQNQMYCCLEIQEEDTCQTTCAVPIIDCVTDTSCIFVWTAFTGTELDGPGSFFDFNDDYCGNPDTAANCNDAWDTVFDCIITGCTG